MRRRARTSKVTSGNANGLAAMQILKTALSTSAGNHTMNLIQSIRAFIRDEDGAAAIEYGLSSALIAIAIIVGATLLGTSLNGLFTRLGNCMATPTAAVCALVA